MRPMGRWHATCWKSRTRRHDGLGHRHPQATRGRRAARTPAPAAGSRLLWADTTYDNMHRGMDIISVMALVPKWTLANANLRQSHGLWVMTISNDSVLTRIIPGTYEQIYCYFNKMLELEKASYVPESGCCKDHLKTREGLVRRAKLWLN